MKVKIGPYKNWYGPYQLAELIPFISEETQNNIGEYLSNTWVMNLCEWYDSKKSRKIDIRIDRWDTWGMDHTLALIILPMLKQLKETKHGSPIVDDEDIPTYLRYSDPKEEYYGADNWTHYKWEWILNEMIFAFENLVDDSWEEKFIHGVPEYKCELISGEDDNDNAVYSHEQINPDYWVDVDAYKEYNNRIDNGLRLFGKYFRNLWD